MITLIHGSKGSGKTKRIIDAVNNAALHCSGDVVYITDKAKHSVEVKHTVRFVDASEYGIKNADAAIGFIKGILSVNNDIALIFIDGLARMANTALADMAEFYKELEALSASDKVDFTITVSADDKDMPDYLKKYI